MYVFISTISEMKNLLDSLPQRVEIAGAMVSEITAGWAEIPDWRIDG